MTALLIGVFLGLLVAVLTLLARVIKDESKWLGGELCPLCERPVDECGGCKPNYLRPSLCDCTDCGRNQPLDECPRCGGTGELK